MHICSDKVWLVLHEAVANRAWEYRPPLRLAPHEAELEAAHRPKRTATYTYFSPVP
ncbi:Uncharacterised protein [Mobiluncus mulieris]|uniref:hypothetical protein n=1 Tax=Mobiluncus mulieris TaxID=2052 RepID=UPI0002E00AB9|nr:hypothetical protein [Mobiluncus mulieris]SPX71226.1 Uncharacterised protein [Mobiluncus mulieris]